MMNLKLASFNQRPTMIKDKYIRNNTRRNYSSNFHKCPVNTLLTSIFSGIAWNG